MKSDCSTRLFLVGLVIALAPAIASSAPSPKAASNVPVIDGERFVKRTFIDQQSGGMAAGWVFAPEKWRWSSKIEWHYDWFDNPVVVSCSIENPASAEAFYCYPQLRLLWIELPPQLQRYQKHPPQPGSVSGGGAINLQPRPPLEALALFVKRTRGNEPNVHPIGSKNLPDLPKALGLADLPNAHGVGIKIGYDLAGEPVEEAFFAVYYLVPPANVSGATQTNWGLEKLHSYRAPAGQLDQRMAVAAAIEKSFQPNHDWARRVQAVQTLMRNKVQEKIKQGYQQIEAAHQVMEEVMANEAAFDKQIAQFDANLRANPAGANAAGGGPGGGGSGGGRSAWDKFDDNIRGVDTVDDPFWGQSQHSNLEKYHWTDGYGNYVNTNDPNYNPSADNPGNWTLMQESK